MSVLNQIQDRIVNSPFLSEHSLAGVYYGACTEKTLEKWNYIVFNRLKTTKSSNRVDFQTFYQISIVHENFVPEGMVKELIELLTESKDGERLLRITSDDIDYNYTFKGNSNLVVEIATITLFHPEKRE